MIDAAELARLRGDSAAGHVSSPATVLSLIGALEKARENEIREINMGQRFKRERDSARALAKLSGTQPALRPSPSQSDYAPTDHERSLAGDIIETVSDFDIDYDERTEAVFLAFAAVRAEATLAARERILSEIADKSPEIAAAIRARP